MSRHTTYMSEHACLSNPWHVLNNKNPSFFWFVSCSPIDDSSPPQLLVLCPVDCWLFFVLRK
jgi:hypothetical protein